MRRYFFVLLSIVLLGCSSQKGISLEAGDDTTPLEQFRIDHLKGMIEYDDGPITKKDLKHISFFEENEDLVVRAHFKKWQDPDSLIMPTSAGKQKTFLHYGTAYFYLQGQNLELNIYQNVKLLSNPLYQDHLFLPYKDATNGVTTYGAGRYIDLSLSDIEEGYITIDFNRSYNPWCAYSDGFNCPIPPLSNHLPVPIKAGEKDYTGKKRS